MNDRVLQPLNAFFDALDLGLQQVPKIIKAFVDVVKTSVDSVPKVVDAAILKEKAKQVAAYYHGDRTPLGERIHRWIYSINATARNGIVLFMDLHAIRLEIPADGNIIVGHSHFIKTVEDIYEAIVNTVPQMKFGIAFNEASGACLTRVDGNDDELKALAARNATAVGAGHLFVVALRGGFPINVKNRILETPEVCNIFCATANPVEVIVAQTEQGRGVLGVIDGSPPKGIEGPSDVEWRHGLLRKIGYKR